MRGQGSGAPLAVRSSAAASLLCRICGAVRGRTDRRQCGARATVGQQQQQPGDQVQGQTAPGDEQGKLVPLSIIHMFKHFGQENYAYQYVIITIRLNVQHLKTH